MKLLIFLLALPQAALADDDVPQTRLADDDGDCYQYNNVYCDDSTVMYNTGCDSTCSSCASEVDYTAYSGGMYTCVEDFDDYDFDDFADFYVNGSYAGALQGCYYDDCSSSYSYAFSYSYSYSYSDDDDDGAPTPAPAPSSVLSVSGAPGGTAPSPRLLALSLVVLGIGAAAAV